MDRSEEPTTLADAIRLLLRDMVEPKGIATHLDDRLSEEPTVEARTVVYRIVREALVNVLQHAHARSVVIAIETDHGGVLVALEDDGAGFDVATVFDVPSIHLGLKVMRERAEMSGGWLRVDSAIGRGATINFWIPSFTLTSDR
jgi:signal transduction histidine kinase